MRSSWRMFVIIMTACMLGFYTPTGKLSFHLLTASLALTTLLTLTTGILPKGLRLPIQLLISEAVIILSIVDVFCQTYLLNGITPQLFITIFLTNLHETSDFIRSYIHPNILLQWRISTLLLLSITNPLLYVPSIKCYISQLHHRMSDKAKRHLTSILWVCIMLSAVVEAQPTFHLMQFFSPSCDAMATEEFIFRRYHEESPLPMHRLLHAWAVTRQSERLLEGIIQSTITAHIDSCSHRSQHIMLIIGESHNKHHSSLYGYQLPTSPLQQRRSNEGSLTVFDDAVTPWNITSNVFLNMFSTWDSSAPDNIDNYPLFPTLFRKAGYQVTFFSNQYVTKGFHRGSTNQAGHFFLSNRTLCEEMFDLRNLKAHGLDMRLVREFAKQKERRNPATPTLDIIHLIGQHFDYKSRYPLDESQFSTRDYQRPDLDKDALEIVMHYDNATHYNDEVVDNILSLYEDDEAIIIYIADHGEEAYDTPGVFGRLFQTPTWNIAHYEFEIPMWIWCSESYRLQHPDMVSAIRQSCHKAFLSDDLPQILFHAADLHCPWRNDSRNILSSSYKTKKRIIAGSTDYDALRPNNIPK